MSFKSARIKAGLSAKEAAERLGVSVASVSYWESGACGPISKRLPEIARLYGVSVDELLQTDETDWKNE